MDSQKVLMDRIERSLADIGRARKVVSNMADDRFRNRMQVRFDSDFTRHQNDSLALLEAVRDGKNLQDCWQSFSVMDSDLRSLLEECMSLQQGTMERQAGLDDGICDIADAVLEYLCRLADIGWRRFTVLGSEYLTERTGVVRVRFPSASIWDLLLLAHEFGHVIEHDIRADDDDGSKFEVLAQFLNKSTQGAQQHAFLREHYADILATYAVGPMFGWAVISQQFDPISAFDPEGDLDAHPSAAKRMHVIFRTLELMDGDEPGLLRYGGERARMIQLWEAMLAAAGCKPGGLQRKTISQLDRDQAGMFRVVSEHLPMLRYSGWDRARTLAEQVRASDAPPEPGPSVTIIDALNAAWMVRLAQPDADVFAMRHIGEKFEKICQHIVRKGN
jgi:hypothetical protein